MLLCRRHSQVLVYDWTEPGDSEIIVEDIERLNFDYYGQYEEQQKDWRLYNDEYATYRRLMYSRTYDIKAILHDAQRMTVPDAIYMFYTAEESRNLNEVTKWVGIK